jgi:hypothetical protein
MVSSEYSGNPDPASGSRIARLPHRADGIGRALRSVGRIENSLPDDMLQLLKALDEVPDCFNGRG